MRQRHHHRICFFNRLLLHSRRNQHTSFTAPTKTINIFSPQSRGSGDSAAPAFQPKRTRINDNNQRNNHKKNVRPTRLNDFFSLHAQRWHSQRSRTQTLGTGTMGRPDDPVPHRSHHVDPRRGLQGCGFWEEATATSEEGALNAYLSELENLMGSGERYDHNDDYEKLNTTNSGALRR